MSLYNDIITKLPGIAEPKTHINFKSRLKWSALILLLFLFMGQVTLYGVAPEALQRFQFFEMILGSSIGSLITLGIGPIVTASIILQLLVGSKLLPWDLKTPEGKSRFQGTQKLLAIFFCIFEAYAFVAFGAVQSANPNAGTTFLLIAQLAAGAFLLLLMDEVVSKWGIGSGVSLFIAAGVAKTIFVRTFNPLSGGGDTPVGLLPQAIFFLGSGEIGGAMLALLPVIATVLVFLLVVYVQALRVEIPLAFGSIRGFSRRWPLKLIYTSNIPVILVAALLANIQLMAQVTARSVDQATKCGFLGCFDNQGTPISGIVYFLQQPGVQQDLQIQVFFLVFLASVLAIALSFYYLKISANLKVISASIVAGLLFAVLISGSTAGLPTSEAVLRSMVYFLVLVGGSVLFSVFWVSTSGMDAHSVAEQIQSMGMQVPGFRRDPRIVEQVLDRYIPTLAVISGLFIGTLAAMADLTSAIGSGTGILLAVMIIYNFYEQISARYVEDMHPAFRKFFGG